MIHLSRLILNPRGREVRRDLANCQDLHRTLMSGFPHSDGDAVGARQRFGVLYRLEPSPRGGGPPTLLVQSDVAPDWSRLAPSYLLETADALNPACRSVDAAYRTLTPGRVLRFRLRANPTRKVDTRSGADGERRNGRRVPVANDEARLTWLSDKATAGGFRLLKVRERTDVPDVRANAIEEVIGFRRDPAAADGAARQKLTFAGILFDGNLVVTDPERFYETLRQGIGPAKAYGYGLLSIGPTRE